MINYLGRLAVTMLSLSAVAHDFNFNESVDAAVLAIDMEQWLRDVEHLASYNRYYRSDDINHARDWLLEQFSDLGLKASLEEIAIGRYRGYNVVAEIPGSKDTDDIYIIGAHYDSISENTRVLAPGAEDNASGTAGLLAIAKAMMLQKPKSTVRFVAFSGEEAGLYGSQDHVTKLIARGEQERVRGVLIMDMIGFSQDDDLDALIETSHENQYLIDLLKASARKYSEGRLETSFNYWGSDHVPFINNGFMAALLIENDYNDYPDYHRSTDLIDNLNIDMARVILNMMVGAIGYWVF